jgi:3-deoxy-D-manno-octulosonic-acid transferase
MSWLLDCLYAVAAVCLLPWWLWKLPRAARYRAGLRQRLGFAPKLPATPRLWVHCASVGEAAVPVRLLTEFARAHPDWDVAFSANTNTGAARLSELYPGHTVFYMPLDLSPCVRAALSRVQPRVVILAELELWPNFTQACARLGIPVAIVNGRIGARSRRLLGLANGIWPRLWEPVRVCCARSPEDAAGFSQAGLPADRVFNCGLLKCDGPTLTRDAEHEGRLRALFAISAEAPVLVAGSTHEGEEAMIAEAYEELKAHHPRLRLILAPRHVERAAAAAALLEARGLPVARKSALEAAQARAAGHEVAIVDTIGDLVACYGLATCAFVGRSLVPPGGGQNVLEPAALGKPVLTGPYTSNFEPEMALLRGAGAAVVVRSASELTQQVDRLLSDPDAAARMGQAGARVVRESQGATARTLARLEPLFQTAS